MIRLGTRADYADQTNDASVNYSAVTTNGKPKYITCFPNAVEMCLDITKQTPKIGIKGVQTADIIVMAMMNPHNKEMLLKVRNLDHRAFPPYTVPQYYPAMLELLSGDKVCAYKMGVTWDVVKANIDKGQPMVICVGYPVGDHCITINGYDPDPGNPKISICDPYPLNYPDGNGYNRDYNFYKGKENWELAYSPHYAGLRVYPWYLEFYRA